MTKLISMIVAALFAAVSVSAIAADAPAKGDKMEKSDGKKGDGKGDKKGDKKGDAKGDKKGGDKKGDDKKGDKK